MADLSLENPPVGHELAPRIERAYELYPCDVLFVHRDAESQSLARRREEIESAGAATLGIPWVPVVPVKMTEAWLLIDEQAIRRAADNPSGSQDLALPSVHRIEDLSNPKRSLRELLLEASQKRGRKRESFKRSLPRRIQRVADLIDDYSPLRELEAFRTFEEHAQIALARARRNFQD